MNENQLLTKAIDTIINHHLNVEKLDLFNVSFTLSLVWTAYDKTEMLAILMNRIKKLKVSDDKQN